MSLQQLSVVRDRGKRVGSLILVVSLALFVFSWCKLGRFLGSCQRSEMRTERSQEHSVTAIGLESLCSEAGHWGS